MFPISTSPPWRNGTRTLECPTKRTAMGRQGQATIREHFTWHRIHGRVHGILRTNSVTMPKCHSRSRSSFPTIAMPVTWSSGFGVFSTRHFDPMRSFSWIMRRPMTVWKWPGDSPRVAGPDEDHREPRNNGSTFRQWMKGLSWRPATWCGSPRPTILPSGASGAASPEFYDPEVVTGLLPVGNHRPPRRVAFDHFLEHTDDLSTIAGGCPFRSPATKRSSSP